MLRTFRSCPSLKQRLPLVSCLSTTSNNQVDITVIGATGFTGNLITEYLTSKQHSPNLKIAIAGRNIDKLNTLKNKLELQYNGQWPGAIPEVVVAETHDTKTLDELVSRSKVILNCSGPYLKLGKPIVESCARLGTDYIDITGETPYAKYIIDQHSKQAEETGSFIVSMCGFDSLPSDIGVYKTVLRIKNELNENTRRISTFVKMKGNLSGGTMESFMNMEKDPILFKQLRNPFLLGGFSDKELRKEDEDVNEALNLSSIDFLPWIDTSSNSNSNSNSDSNSDSDSEKFPKTPNAWTGPFMMAEINTRVVRKSNYLFSKHDHNIGYNENFGYSERMLIPNEKLANKLAAPLPPIEKREEMRLQGRLPKPGEGPSKEERDKSSFTFYLVGESDSGKLVLTTVSGGDPGYGETSKMVSEAALSLVLSRNECNAYKNHQYKGGVFTPSFTFGNVLLKRLQNAGIQIIDEETPEDMAEYLNSVMSK